MKIVSSPNCLCFLTSKKGANAMFSHLVRDFLIGVVAKQCHVGANMIKLETWFGDLQLDSTDRKQIIQELEMQFDISIPEDDFVSLPTVGQAADYVCNLLAVATA